MLGEFVTPSVIGNAIGGVLLVALLNYGQVAAEKENVRRKMLSRGGRTARR
jgi:formate/nitrite transporter FocA (FNT family)